jgi:hypothetical protein
MLKYFRFPFATAGDRATVPDPAEAGGDVSYSAGYTPYYDLDQSDPLSKDIERNKLNQILYDITKAIGEQQQQGIPDFIDSALNGGTALSYAKYAVVRYANRLYISIADSNTSAPTDTTKWADFPTPDILQTQKFNVCTAGGTTDAMTATLTPAIAAYPSILVFWCGVGTGGANTTTTPTINLNGLGAKTIARGAAAGTAPLEIGDIPGLGAWCLFVWDASINKVVLLNPAIAQNSRKLDGYSQATTATANTIARRDGSGNLTANQFIGTATNSALLDGLDSATAATANTIAARDGTGGLSMAKAIISSAINQTPSISQVGVFASGSNEMQKVSLSQFISQVVTASPGANGFIKIPFSAAAGTAPICLAWGDLPSLSANSNQTISFPSGAFSSTPYALILGATFGSANGGGADAGAKYDTLTSTSFVYYNGWDGTSSPSKYICIGPG